LEPDKIRVLIVDDEPAILKALQTWLTRKGCQVTALESPLTVSEVLAASEFDVALLDIRMPHISGMELLTMVRHRRPEVEVIMMTGYGGADTAVAAIRAGAYDYLTKPFDDIEQVSQVVEKAAAHKRARDSAQADPTNKDGSGIVGSSGAMREVLRMVDAVAYSESTVLLQGESGTGKELVARALHQRSKRSAKPFVAVNCAALSETLLESELFGHVKGAFTGASADHKGFFETADGGTLFLDEIGDISAATQVRLLRILQEGELRRVGAAQPTKVDVRIIAATHRDLVKLVKAGKFREDLFYRLNVISIPLPPLRERVEDVPLLAHHFLRRYASQLNKRLKQISPAAMELLCSHRWPGNVRELENALERAVVMCRTEVLGPSELPPGIADRAAPMVRAATAGGAGEDLKLLAMTYAAAKEMVLQRFEKTYIDGLMSACEQNISAASRRAGLDRSNFKRLLRKHGAAESAGGGGDADPGSGEPQA
jgi:two-component system response regulator HydG